MKIDKTDFKFKDTDFGQCKVSYTCPETGTVYTRFIDDYQLLKRTQHADKPLYCDLKELMRCCK